MRLSDFSYELPDELIARYPLAERSSSRLLCLRGDEILHRRFSDVVALINPNDLLVCNNTRVIPARLFGKKESGGRVEMLIERILDSHTFTAHVRASKSPKAGSKILLENAMHFEMIKRIDDLFELHSDENIFEVIAAIGQIPLPPYFARQPEESDKERYQTVYAKENGSVAAPTAGLHFDKNILDQLQEKGVDIAYLTLHVGSGTFAPVRVQEIEKHKMHAEYLSVSEALCEKVRQTKANGGRVIAVGTTAARSLETASRKGVIEPFEGDTDIFIYPGYEFKCVDALITNFHLPGSTLLMLVAAFAGYDNIMKAYQQAVIEKYRFFSYGDAMFLNPMMKISGGQMKLILENKIQ